MNTLKVALNAAGGILFIGILVALVYVAGSVSDGFTTAQPPRTEEVSK